MRKMDVARVLRVVSVMACVSQLVGNVGITVDPALVPR